MVQQEKYHVSYCTRTILIVGVWRLRTTFTPRCEKWCVTWFDGNHLYGQNFGTNHTRHLWRLATEIVGKPSLTWYTMGIHASSPSCFLMQTFYLKWSDCIHSPLLSIPFWHSYQGAFIHTKGQAQSEEIQGIPNMEFPMPHVLHSLKIGTQKVQIVLL